ncbi:hypothetical protein FHS27_001523 [Rhodopirellula rubra]|uniref:Uncharacterized protein n=1 Tax=Aporhodopirellula rubra TaxID=980271 RepID=A0A7W5H4U7_9BACT|nr:hypothetical protein [Aporhodopirellula rubra]MBB3205719.1 hypothetical protein [Aporhodopirellula rubra]
MKILQLIMLSTFCCLPLTFTGCGGGGEPQMIPPERSADEIQASADEKEKVGQGIIPD